MKSLISVIVIVKDNEKTLGNAIESALGQSHKNLELIIVDDGSRDATPAIIERFAGSDSRVRCLTNEANMGRAYSRNLGISSAGGSYLIFLDSDDELPLDSVENQYNVAVNQDADIVFGRTKCFRIDTGEKVARHYTDQFINVERHGIRLADHPDLVNNHQVVGRLFSSEFLRNERLTFSNRRRNAEDLLFSFYTAFHARRLSIVPSLEAYRYQIGNYLLTANLRKLEDARDNLLETLHFSELCASASIAERMRLKAAQFAANLIRAEAVFGESPQELQTYVATLRPLVASINQQVLKLLPAWQASVVNAIRDQRYDRAIDLWKSRTEAQCCSSSSQSPQENKNVYQPASKEDDEVALAVELRRNSRQAEKKSRRLDALLSSKSWVITHPLRFVYGLFSGAPTKNYSTCISVIIPIHNVENYLAECLESVTTQSFRSIEIICVNDCSPDNSKRIVERYASGDCRIRLVDHKKNLGLAAARNSGLRNARGRYVYFLDSDDYLACTDALETLWNIAVLDNADQVIGGVIKWYQNSGEAGIGWHAQYLGQEVRASDFMELPCLRANVVAWNKLIRRSLLTKNNISFDPAIRKHEDNPFSVKVHILSRRISIVRKTTYVYRQERAGSLLSATTMGDCYERLKYLEDIFTFFNMEKRSVEHFPLLYPVYLHHLFETAKLLARFKPTDTDIKRLFDGWLSIIKQIDLNLPFIKESQRTAIGFVQAGNLQSAWATAAKPGHDGNRMRKQNEPREQCRMLHRSRFYYRESPITEEDQINLQRRFIKLLDKRIEAIENSLSWRLTTPIRSVLKSGT